MNEGDIDPGDATILSLRVGLLDGDGVVDPGEIAVCLWVGVLDPALVVRRPEVGVSDPALVRSPEVGVLDPALVRSPEVDVLDSGEADVSL